MTFFFFFWNFYLRHYYTEFWKLRTDERFWFCKSRGNHDNHIRKYSEVIFVTLRHLLFLLQHWTLFLFCTCDIVHSFLCFIKGPKKRIQFDWRDCHVRISKTNMKTWNCLYGFTVIVECWKLWREHLVLPYILVQCLSSYIECHKTSR